MKIISKFKDLVQTIDGTGLLTLKIDNIRHFEMLKELVEDKLYSVEFKEAKSKRTLEQNRYLWLLIHEIDKAMNGKHNDEMEVYTMLLERASAKFDFIEASEKVEEALSLHFRAWKRVKEIDFYGAKGYTYKVFLGSSKMDKNEMKQLIDSALDVAGELGLDLDYWKVMLYGSKK